MAILSCHVSIKLPPKISDGQAFFFLGRRRLVECSIGMHMADEVNVGRQVREDALTAVGAVTGDDDLLVGEPLGHHDDEFQG